MKVAAVQHDVLWQNANANFSRVGAMARSAADAGANLIVLPERFATGQASPAATAVDDESRIVSFLVELAESTGRTICGSSTAEIEQSAVTTMLLVEPHGVVHRSIQRDPTVDADTTDRERQLSTFTLGDLRVTPVAGSALVDPIIFRRAALSTDAFLVCSSQPENRRRQWKTLLAARAIENQSYVVGVNRVGAGGNSTYVGDSRIVDPHGSVLTTAWGGETTLFAELESALVRFIRDRNPQRSGMIRL